MRNVSTIHVSCPRCSFVTELNLLLKVLHGPIAESTEVVPPNLHPDLIGKAAIGLDFDAIRKELLPWVSKIVTGHVDSVQHELTMLKSTLFCKAEELMKECET